VRTRVGAYAVVLDEDRLLLAQLTARESGRWTLPGGGVNHCEAPEDAVGREVLEETGYTVEVGGLLGVDSLVVPAGRRLDGGTTDLHHIRLVYRARVVGGELRDEVDGSTERADWIPVAGLSEVPRVELVDRALAMSGLLVS
jgi:8-oxo-dGTP diphosphatase